MFRTIFLVAFMTVAAVASATAEPSSQALDDSCEIAVLIGTSAALGLPARVERAFMLTLHSAYEACNRGEIQRALTLLRTFAFEVRSVRRAKRVPANAADMLLGHTEDAIRYLSNAVHLQ